MIREWCQNRVTWRRSRRDLALIDRQSHGIRGGYGVGLIDNEPLMAALCQPRVVRDFTTVDQLVADFLADIAEERTG